MADLADLRARLDRLEAEARDLRVTLTRLAAAEQGRVTLIDRVRAALGAAPASLHEITHAAGSGNPLSVRSTLYRLVASGEARKGRHGWVARG